MIIKKITLNSILILSIFNIVNPLLLNNNIAPRFFIYGIIFIFILITLYNYRDSKDIFFNHTVIKQLLLLYIFLILINVVSSNFFLLSFMKISYWVITVLIIALNLLEFNGINQFIDNIIKSLVVVNIVSCIFLFFGLGYEVTYGTGYNGAINHPQALGILMALLSLFMLQKIKISKGREFIFNCTIFSTSLFLLVLSRSRTAIFSFLMALLLSFAGKQIIKKSKVVLLVIPMVIIFISIASSNFLLAKNDGAENLIDAYIKSRSILILPMLDNIKNNLYFGIGFGVDSNLNDAKVAYDPSLYIPISGSNEKGNLYIQILEENGIFGFIVITMCFVKILLSTFRFTLFKSQILLFIFLVNMGEAIIFGVNGLGLIILLIMFSLFFYESKEANFKDHVAR